MKKETAEKARKAGRESARSRPEDRKAEARFVAEGGNDAPAERKDVRGKRTGNKAKRDPGDWRYPFYKHL